MMCWQILEFSLTDMWNMSPITAGLRGFSNWKCQTFCSGLNYDNLSYTRDFYIFWIKCNFRYLEYCLAWVTVHHCYTSKYDPSMGHSGQIIWTVSVWLVLTWALETIDWLSSKCTSCVVDSIPTTFNYDVCIPSFATEKNWTL